MASGSSVVAKIFDLSQRSLDLLVFADFSIRTFLCQSHCELSVEKIHNLISTC